MGKLPCGVNQNFGLFPIHAKLLFVWVSLSVFQMYYERIPKESAKDKNVSSGVEYHNTSLYFIITPRVQSYLR